jgi:RNA polymerase sigma-70 factor, ECF subfamily
MPVADRQLALQELREPLAGFIARRVSDPQDAEDVLQEVLLRIHRHAGELADADRVLAWVHRIARNAIVDHYRRRAARPEHAAGAADDFGDVVATNDEPTDASRRELAHCLRPLLERLPDKHRQAVILTELEGFTQVDAARRLGVTVSGMKARVQRGRAQLKTLLLECCEVELDRRGAIAEYSARGGSCGRCGSAT